VQGPEFKLQYCLKKKKEEEEEVQSADSGSRKRKGRKEESQQRQYSKARYCHGQPKSHWESLKV
jgi:hypothetical protein